MKKIFSRNNLFTILWVIFHAAILIAFLVTLKFYGGFTFDGDYTTLMPSTHSSKAVKIAEDSIGKVTGNSIFILAGNENFEKAEKAAINAYDSLKDNPKFKSITLYTDAQSISEVQDFIGKWRTNLLSPASREKILSNPKEFAQNAKMKAYGLSIAENDPEKDPFMLDDENLKNYLSAFSDSGTALSAKDNVMAGEYNGKWYVMIRAELTAEGAKLASDINVIPEIYDVCYALETDGTHFAFYGTPFHSYSGSSKAIKEVSIISAVTITIIIVMLLVVFRSMLPLVASLIALLVSCGAAFLVTHTFFGNIHLIAIIFGTSLIGSCIDYSLHFFINWKGSTELKTGEQIRKHLTNGLFLSLISTEICYLLLTFAPFTMLKQISVFSFTGILSSFLTTVGIFPLFKVPCDEKRQIPILEKIFKNGVDTPENPEHRRKRKFWGKVVIVAAFTFTIGSMIIFRDELRVQNDIQNLYKPTGRLKEDSLTAFEVIKYNPRSWLIVSGDSAEEVLQKEEKIIPRMPDPFISTARFIPSIKSQKESYAAAKELIPLADSQLKSMLYPEDIDGEEAELSKEENEELSKISEDFKRDFDSMQEKFVTPESGELPKALQSILKMLWIGQVDGKYYSIILPTTVQDEEVYINLASDDENLHYENKPKAVSSGLDRLTKMVAIMFAIAFAIITIVVKFYYNGRDTFKIITIPLISILVIITTFLYCELPIEFFCITGVILVFGLGLDYVIYKRQNKGNKIEGFAITLSFLTTAISFGAIILSSFVPVHVLGLSIFSGILAAYICTML
ncbi:MMPL family transporter [Treponema zioleckii]|uniref:MMPL family transporter n=1 Tax=Treponema zioleckii TaxID=331680 RepID=UPI00168BF347|nr:MMPL family transporter [Treponema zioleckii]